jgi:23S rRNA (cytidine1920-2'-O)/16S rRNA (cytidine1409-2'-O)-methyltransferase
MASGTRTRLDETLVVRNLAETRAKARALVMAGDVLVDGIVITAAGKPVGEHQLITLREKPRFVSRGGEKLDHALIAFGLDPTGWTCADFGASTGGFTDCLLQRGASRVYAIDVGYGQLHARIRNDARVVVMEKENVRLLDSLPEPIDLVVIDVSFISLKLVLPAARAAIQPAGYVVPLIKPQFEAGRSEIGKGGVVRDSAVHQLVIKRVVADAEQIGFATTGMTRSPITGPAGNIEFLALMSLDATSATCDELLHQAGLDHATV